MKRLAEMLDMSGRRVVVTGAAGALGRTICETMAETGADILLVDRAESGLAELADHLARSGAGRVEQHSCDLEDGEARAALADAVIAGGGATVLINNAAFVGTSGLTGWAEQFAGQTVDTWRRALEVNLTAPFDLCQRLAAPLAASGRGSIINVGSIYGILGPNWSLYEGTPMANPAAYAASKGGLVQLTRWLATTLAPGVRVNCICPGGIYRGQPEAFVQRYEAQTPLRRMATEDDFRGAFAFLAGDMSKYVTGQTFLVDGGWSAW